MRRLTAFLILIMTSCAFPLFGDAALEKITGERRNDYLKMANVWKPTDVSNMDILAGPQNEISVPPGAEVTCRYVEWAKGQGTGYEPKFLCKLINSGVVVRIKYGNREIFSKIAASRLFWALGFYADEDYSVRLKCLDCPEKSPFHPAKNERRVVRIFDPALMERNFPGVIIEESHDQGWKWSEVDKVDEKRGGATQAQIDALKLLAVFLQHSDNKASQQRLACYREDVRDPNDSGIGVCTRPVMMIADLGGTFGAGSQTSAEDQKMNFVGWDKTDVWSHWKENEHLLRTSQKVCYGDLTNTKAAGTDGLYDPVISEEGRRFLADLLNRLTLEQIKDLFRASRLDRFNNYAKVDDKFRRITIEDWTAAFLKKRDQINQQRCPMMLPHESVSRLQHLSVLPIFNSR